MSRILITGATGNVGTEVVKALHNVAHSHTVYAAVRDVNAGTGLAAYNAQPVLFDFENSESQMEALQQTDVLCLISLLFNRQRMWAGRVRLANRLSL